MNDLEKLFCSELTAIYDGEKQLTQALKKLEQAAKAAELRNALREHLDETKNHVARLEQIFGELSQPTKRKPCHGATGIVDEALTLLEDFKGHPALDVGIAASGLKAEHFEIAAYGTLCSWAEELDHDTALGLLKENLRDEKRAETKLSGLGEMTVRNVAEADQLRDLYILFVRQLRGMLDAEHLLVGALSELQFYSNSKLLKFGFHHHHSQTEKHAERLKKVFGALGETVDRKPCDGIEGIIDDAQVGVMEFLGNSALDAALIAGAQKAEHYEIASYNGLISLAEELAPNVIPLLEDNLNDEISTDKQLSLAAEYLRNPKAAKGESAKESPERAEFLKLATHAG